MMLSGPRAEVLDVQDRVSRTLSFISCSFISSPTPVSPSFSSSSSTPSLFSSHRKFAFSSAFAFSSYFISFSFRSFNVFILVFDPYGFLASLTTSYKSFNRSPSGISASPSFSFPLSSTSTSSFQLSISFTSLPSVLYSLDLSPLFLPLSLSLLGHQVPHPTIFLSFD